MVGLGGGDPRRGRRRALQLPRRLQAQRGDRRHGHGRSRRVAWTAPFGRRRRLVAGLAAGGAAVAGPARGVACPPAPDRHVDHAVRARGPLERQAGHRVHAAGLVRRDRRAGTGKAGTAPRLRRRTDRRVARRPLRRHRNAGRPSTCRVGRGARRRFHARDPGDVPHLLPGDLQRPTGSTDAPEAVRGDAGRGGGE